MQSKFLKAKLHMGSVTHAELWYDGSCAIDSPLIWHFFIYKENEKKITICLLKLRNNFSFIYIIFVYVNKKLKNSNC